MVSSFAANMQQSLYQSASLGLDTKHAQTRYDDDDNVLDENILESSAIDSGLELSPPMVGSRRESFALGGPPLFSPKTEDWQSVDMQSAPSNNPFFQQNANNNPFMHLEQNHGNAFGSQSNGWNMDQMHGLPSQFDPSGSLFRSMTGQTPFTAHAGNMFANLVSDNQSGLNSTNKEGMGSSHSMDGQSIGKKTRPATPIIRSHRDGIRKKNARFDIPSEYTLANIDEKIENEKDPDKKKLLKSHKRLLRNRQAALDSRQRKKQHTERLEDEKKHFTVVINEMEEEMNALKIRMEQLFREKQEYAECINRLTTERDELIVSHTNESGELRKKIAVLSDHVRRLDPDPATASASNNSNSYSGYYGDMEDLAMSGPWEHGNFINDFAPEAEVKQEMSMIPTKKNESAFATDGDKSSPQQGGLLFMLFLVGAFVLSNRSPQPIPHVSEDVREASATLLNNVLKDAGVGGSAPSNSMQPMAPQPSGTWTESGNSMQMNNVNLDTVSPSMLGELGNSLTQPTQEQTNEQLFSLSEAQYHGVHSQDFLHNTAPAERFSSAGRRNLAEALAGLRVTNKQDGAAEVYTRSLLWDQIPGDVVRNFAKMVAECNNAQNEQQCNEAIS